MKKKYLMWYPIFLLFSSFLFIKAFSKLIEPLFGVLYVDFYNIPLVITIILSAGVIPLFQGDLIMILVSLLLLSLQLGFNVLQLPYIISENPYLGSFFGLISLYIYLICISGYLKKIEVSFFGFLVFTLLIYFNQDSRNPFTLIYTALWNYLGSTGCIISCLIMNIIWINIKNVLQIEPIQEKSNYKGKNEKFKIQLNMKKSNKWLIWLLSIMIVTICTLTIMILPQYNLFRKIYELEEMNFNDGIKVISRIESNTGFLSVIDDLKNDYEPKYLRCDHSLLGGFFTKYNNESIFGIFYAMEFVRFIERSFNLNELKVLQLGLGIGTSTKALYDNLNKKIEMDIIELDPMVIKFAQDYFNYPLDETKIKFFDQDAFLYLKKNQKKYSFILHDLFTGGFVPKHLYTIETMKLIKKSLVPEGILVLNIVAAIESKTLDSVYKTINQVFDFIKIYGELHHEEKVHNITSLRNIIIYASAQPIKFNLPQENTYAGIYGMILNLFPQMELNYYPSTNSSILTNEINPLNDFQNEAAIEHFKVMRKVFPLEMWINF